MSGSAPSMMGGGSPFDPQQQPGPPPLMPGLPPGGGFDPGGMDGDPFMAALGMGMGDPYAQPAVALPTDLNVGPTDPKGGLMALLQQLSLAQAGVAGGPGGSGVPMDPMGGIGLMS
jgi:hypothetical protein